MNTKPTIIVLLTAWMALNTAKAQTRDIQFFQEQEITLEKTNKEYFQLTIKPAPFTIVFNGNELHVCTGLEEDIFSAAKAKTDINADFNSCFYIFKYGAMEKDADYLFVGSDAPTSLNETHGANVEGNQSKFTVSALYSGDKEKPLSDFRKFYMALWLDSNKDQYVDGKELLKVSVTVK